MEYNHACMLKPKDFEEMRRVSSCAFNNAQKLLEIVNKQMGKRKSIISKHKDIPSISHDEDQSVETIVSVSASAKKLKPYQLQKFESKPKTLEYQLKIYKQKKKYAPNKSFESLKEMPKSCFIRTNFQNGSDFSHSTSTIQTPKKNYLGNKLVLFKHKYSSNYNTSFNGNPNNANISSNTNANSNSKSKAKENTRDGYRKPTSPIETPISSQKKFSYTSSLINNITNKANEELDNFKKDIIRNGLRSPSSAKKKTKPKNLFKSKSQVCLDQIRKQYHLDDLKSSKIDQLQLIKQNYDKVKMSLDDKCRSFLKQVINQVVYEDNQLNKPTVCDYSSYHLNQLMRQRQQFAKVGNEMLMIKKEIRGKSAIEPSDDRKTFNKIVNEIIDNDDIEDLIQRKNVLRFKQNFTPIKGRMSSIKKI